MYDELVKALRVCADGEHCDKCTKWELKQNAGRNACEYAICTEAADAIEELSKDLERSKEWESFWEKEANEALKKFQLAVASKPRWIPVTERLPEAGERVLCYCRANIYEVMKMRTDGDWVYDTNHVYMHSFVTHWMPLPKWPEDGNDA